MSVEIAIAVFKGLSFFGIAFANLFFSVMTIIVITLIFNYYILRMRKESWGE